MFRKRLSKKSSRRNFRRGSKIKKRNGASVLRGGRRL